MVLVGLAEGGGGHGRLTVDGVLHAIAFAPPEALGGGFLMTPAAAAEQAFRISAFSLKELAAAMVPLMSGGGAIVGLDFDAAVAWPAYDWMGVSKAALEAVNRYLCRDLGPLDVRANLVSAGPIATAAAGGIPGFDELASAWRGRAPAARSAPPSWTGAGGPRAGSGAPAPGAG